MINYLQHEKHEIILAKRSKHQIQYSLSLTESCHVHVLMINTLTLNIFTLSSYLYGWRTMECIDCVYKACRPEMRWWDSWESFIRQDEIRQTNSQYIFQLSVKVKDELMSVYVYFNIHTFVSHMFAIHFVMLLKTTLNPLWHWRRV